MVALGSAGSTGSAGPPFTELAGAFGGALDDWSAAVKDALAAEGRYQNWLARRLGTPAPKVSLWLRGREQVWLSGAGLPGAATTRAIVRELGLEGPPADRLAALAARIDDLQRQLEALHPRDWRKRAVEHLRGTAPDPAAPDAPPAPPSASTRPAPPRRRRRTASRLAAAAATGVAAAALVAYLASARTTPDTAMPATAPQPATTPRAAALEQPGLEKNTLGADSRCGEPVPGPESVVWRVCARVDADRVAFAVKLTNQADRAATARVRVKVQYARQKAFHACPEAPNPQPVDVPPGRTVITDPARCSIPREPVPYAYQGVGWVVPPNADAGSYELSPTAHVHPDRTIWKPDLL
ncbi:hypothetical protein [Streptomyces globosus]|uniref:hypothetical protein n=1 Tax=Streptomyces globosus TaxID=68209 RepID=UPI001C1F4012|nr:hypothetical protein [Streptomyces globosus]